MYVQSLNDQTHAKDSKQIVDAWIQKEITKLTWAFIVGEIKMKFSKCIEHGLLKVATYKWTTGAELLITPLALAIPWAYQCAIHFLFLVVDADT